GAADAQLRLAVARNARIDSADIDGADASLVYVDQEVASRGQLALEARQRITARSQVAHHAPERSPQALPGHAGAHLAVLHASEPCARRQRSGALARPGIAHFLAASLDVAGLGSLQQPIEDVL